MSKQILFTSMDYFTILAYNFTDMKQISFLILFVVFSIASSPANPPGDIKKDSIRTDTAHQRFSSFQHSFYHHFSTNPAYTGVEECYSSVFSIDKPMMEATLFNKAVNFITAGDFFLHKKYRLALGFMYNYNEGGPFTTGALGLSIAYPFSYKKHHLRIGIGVKYFHQHSKPEQLTFEDEISYDWGYIYAGYDPLSQSFHEFPIEVSLNMADINAGLWYQWEGVFAGFSVNNIVSHDYYYSGFYQKPVRTYIIEAGYDYNPVKKLTLTPSLICIKESFKETAYIPSLSISFNKWIYFSVCYQNFNTFKSYLGFCVLKRIFLYGCAGVSTNSALFEISPLDSFTGGLRFTLK